jgi:exoribonuclease R
VLISSAFERNRAIHGDKVAVEVYARSVQCASDSTAASLLPTGMSLQPLPQCLWFRALTCSPDDEEAIEDSDSIAIAPAKRNNANAHQSFGRVVGILAIKRRPYVCTIQISSTSISERDQSGSDSGAMDPISTAQERILVIPMDRRIPKVRNHTVRPHIAVRQTIDG